MSIEKDIPKRFSSRTPEVDIRSHGIGEAHALGLLNRFTNGSKRLHDRESITQGYEELIMAPAEKPKSPSQIEAFALKLSMVGYLFMAAIGVTFALLTRSEAIMFDGVYSLVSFVMAVLAERVARVVEKPPSETFHFGYAHL
jgi:hypothetical protein